jgi:SAM-dependent methyltransferase
MASPRASLGGFPAKPPKTTPSRAIDPRPGSRGGRVLSGAMSEPDLLPARAAYDAVATLYAEQFKDSLDHRPVERGLLAAFAEKVRQAPAGPVADLGCGPGHIAAHLHGLGLPVLGVDQSAEMLAIGRARYPGVRFARSSITRLGLADGSCSGVLSRSSIIHLPPELLPSALAEFARVLVPGGWLLGNRRLPLVPRPCRIPVADSRSHRDRPPHREPRPRRPPPIPRGIHPGQQNNDYLTRRPPICGAAAPGVRRVVPREDTASKRRRGPQRAL